MTHQPSAVAVIFPPAGQVTRGELTRRTLVTTEQDVIDELKRENAELRAEIERLHARK